jgi:peptide/nickel transport system substrate-binding protein
VAPTAAAVTGPQQGGKLVAATIDKPVNMDPAFAELYSSMQVYQNIFSFLINLDRDSNIVPGLAKDWRQIDDTTWEFNLVDNAWFHNGEHFTAKDVKYTLDRIVDPDLGASNAVFMMPYQGAEVVDDYTVRIMTEPNWGGLIYTLAAMGNIVNQKGIEENDPKLQPVGCGPFKFVEWVKDDHITLERWDKYFRTGKPYVDSVVFRAIADDEVRLTGLLNGELNWIEQVPLHRAEELKQNPEIKANPDGAFLPDMFEFNCSKPPWDKIETRQAVQWALDRKAIVDLVWYGQAYESKEAVAPDNPWYSGEDLYPGAPNLDKARELLAQAGYENGFKTLFAAQPQVQTQVKVGQLIKDQLKPLGIDVEVQSLESARWFEALFTGEYEFTSTYWSATVDPGEHYHYVISHSQSSWNTAFFGHPEMDEALDRYRYTVDPEERKKGYGELTKLQQKHNPDLQQVNMLRTYWTQPTIHGVETLPTLELRMEDVWMG